MSIFNPCDRYILFRRKTDVQENIDGYVKVESGCRNSGSTFVELSFESSTSQSSNFND